MAITKAVENNKSLLRVGLHFEFNDCRLAIFMLTYLLYKQYKKQIVVFAFCAIAITLIHFRNRVAVQLQKNLDRVRLRRVAHKLSTAAAAKAAPASTTSRTGGKFNLKTTILYSSNISVAVFLFSFPHAFDLKYDML